MIGFALWTVCLVLVVVALVLAGVSAGWVVAAVLFVVLLTLLVGAAVLLERLFQW